MNHFIGNTALSGDAFFFYIFLDLVLEIAVLKL